MWPPSPWVPDVGLSPTPRPPSDEDRPPGWHTSPLLQPLVRQQEEPSGQGQSLLHMQEQSTFPGRLGTGTSRPVYGLGYGFGEGFG